MTSGSTIFVCLLFKKKSTDIPGILKFIYKFWVKQKVILIEVLAVPEVLVFPEALSAN